MYFEGVRNMLVHLINGISLGSIYAIIALGYTMVYGILRLINFAHGDVFMAAGMFMVFLSASLPLGLAVPLVLLLTVYLFMLYGYLALVISKIQLRLLRSVVLVKAP